MRVSRLYSRLGASNKACFSSGSKGHNIDNEFISNSSSASFKELQSDESCAASKYRERIFKKLALLNFLSGLVFSRSSVKLSQETSPFEYGKNPSLSSLNRYLLGLYASVIGTRDNGYRAGKARRLLQTFLVKCR